MHKFFIIFFLFFIIKPGITFAQTTNTSTEFDSPYACPNFEFIKNMQKGIVDEDVFVLQQILNLDKRTLVAQTGVGSKGKETISFGNATRDALKRFQALFIEYIEVADGKFNTKTRTVMNNVCKGPFFTGQGGNVYDSATTTKDIIGPTVVVAGPKKITDLSPFRAYVASDEAIKTPNLTGLILEGATANDVRKTSSTTFTFLVTPNEDVSDKISIQFEADSINDLAGNKNEIASNEWVIEVFIGIADATTPDDILDGDFLNTLLDSIPTPGVDCTTVGPISVYDYNNPCYGKAPVSDPTQTPPESGGGAPKQPPPIAEMLKGLMEALKGAAGGKPAGGEVGGEAVCACTGQPTTGFSAKKGISGRNIDMITKGRGTGQFVGDQMPPPPMCGQKKDPKCPQGCCNKQADVTGGIVVGGLVN